MVFKVLSEEEISLLNVEQKVKYEEERNVYQQRVDFVNRLEELEDVKVEQYNMEMSAIEIIQDREINQYQNPEFTLKTSVSVKKPNLQVVSFQSLEQDKPVLPMIMKKPRIQVVYFHQKESARKELPLITKPVVSSRNYNEVKLEQLDLPGVEKITISMKTHKPITNDHPSLPAITKPSINLDMNVEQIATSSNVNTKNLPEVLKTNIPIRKVAMAIDTRHDLPEVLKTNIPNHKVAMAVDTRPDLPEVLKTNIPNHKAAMAVDTRTNLPEVEKMNIPIQKASMDIDTQLNLSGIQRSSIKLDINTNIDKFEKSSKIAPQNLPMVLKINAPIHSVPIENSISPSLPTVKETSIPEHSVTIPIIKAELPQEVIKVYNDRKPFGEMKPIEGVKLTTVVKPDVNIQEFEMKSLPSVHLPKRFRPNINIKEYNGSSQSKIKVTKVPEMSIPKSTYTKDLKIDTPKLPNVREIAVKSKEFNLTELPKPNMPVVKTSIPIININKPLHNQPGNQENQVAITKDYTLHSIMKDSIKIPDASLVLNKLLYELTGETEDLKGLEDEEQRDNDFC
nr:hypothetical protein [uncultured Anaerosporobacter sp.]